MMQVAVHESLSTSERARVVAFLDSSRRRDESGLDDHLAADLAHGPAGGFRAAIATVDQQVVGYAQASAANDGMVIGLVAPGATETEQAELIRAVLAALPPEAAVTWWTNTDSHTLATTLGLQPARSLLEMTCALPIPDTTQVEVRPFRVGSDEAAWLEVNNAAFSWHGEQGGWDLATLTQREHEPWFDPTGFLLHERAGRLAAFCWTKLHHRSTLVGEIYVIAVHPDFHGLGLGRALTVAGLQHLHGAGATQAMLYVDAHNTTAVGLYRALGLQVGRIQQSYLRPPQGDTP